MYKLAEDLINTLNSSGISYCHWKSNINLEKALEGCDDLDLLVAKSDISRFETVISDLNFKQAFNAHISFPFVKHYYGYDENTGNLLHLHIYHRLITGGSMTKAFALNCEDAVLSEPALQFSIVPVPQKHIELVIYVIRTMIKYSCIFEHFAIRSSSKKVIKELDFLCEDLCPDDTSEFIKVNFPQLNDYFLKTCIEAIRDRRHFKLFILGMKLKSAIKSFRRIGILKEIFSGFIQIAYRVLNRICLHQKKFMVNGGIVIAVTGPDACGKTTITEGITAWLSQHFTVERFHTGKPPAAILTVPIEILVRIAKRFNKNLKTCVSSKTEKIGFISALRLTCLAYNRMSITRKCRKKALEGRIVICDRYPSENFGVMDSRRLDRDKCEGLTKKLALLEDSCYSKVPEADLVLELKVSAETAIQRNRDRTKPGKEHDDFILQRHEENTGLTYKAVRSVPIDTEQSLHNVLKQIRSHIWSMI